MDHIDNNSNNNNKDNNNNNKDKENKHKSRLFNNPFKRDVSKLSKNQQQEAAVNNNDNNNDIIDDSNENNSNDLKETANIESTRPTLTRHDSNSSIGSISSSTSVGFAVSTNNSSSSNINRPRSKSEKKDKLSINTLISKASRKSMKITTPIDTQHQDNIPLPLPHSSTTSTTTSTTTTTTTTTTTSSNPLNLSSSSISSNVSMDDSNYHHNHHQNSNRNITGTGSVNSNVLSAQDKKKNRGSIFVRLLSRKNKDDPISEEDFKIESSLSHGNGGSLQLNGTQQQQQQQQQFSSSPNLLSPSYSFNDKEVLHNHQQNHHQNQNNNNNNYSTDYNNNNNHRHGNHHHNMSLTSSMIAPLSSQSQRVSPLKLTASADQQHLQLREREETIKKIQLMATQLNENIKLPKSPRSNSSSNGGTGSSNSLLNGSITPPRIDRQSSEHSFLNNSNNNNSNSSNNNNNSNSNNITPISTTPLSNHNKSYPFDNNCNSNNNNNEEDDDNETDYSIDSSINIDTSSTTSSVFQHQHNNNNNNNITNTSNPIVPSTSSTSLSISSSSVFISSTTQTSPVITSQQQQQPQTINNSNNSFSSANKHKRYTVAIPKWDSSMNFNGNPFERLVQVLRNSQDLSIVNPNFEQTQHQLQLEEQHFIQLQLQLQLQKSSEQSTLEQHQQQDPTPTCSNSTPVKIIPQSVIDGIEEEKQKREILLLSLKKMIQKLISESSDDSILFKSFFTTYDCIFSSRDLLDVFISLFKTESPQIQLRICSIIKCWLKDYNISQLCDYTFASDFKDFVMEIKNTHNSYLYDKIFELRNQLIYLLETKITERCLDINGSSGNRNSKKDDDNNSNTNNEENDNENDIENEINKLSNSQDDNFNTPELIEKKYLNKKATLKIKTFLSTSLKTTGFEFDLMQRQHQQQLSSTPSPPSSPTHSRRFSPQISNDNSVLSLTSLENPNNNFENDYDLHIQQQQQQQTNHKPIRTHSRSTSVNSNNNNISVSFSSNISNSNSTSFSSNNSGIGGSNTSWVQTRPRSSTWSSSDIFLSIMDAPAKEIAKSLTAVDFSIFICIETQELMNGAWGKPHLKDKASNIIKLISRFNEISMNVIQSILNEEKLKDRCKVMARFIKIAKNLHELRNYNSLMAIYAGISHSSITRLKWTKKILPKTHQKTLTDLEKLMESDENFKNYRNELKTITTPCIPFLGLILSDMTFIQEGNTDYVGCNEDTWFLNINKLKLMYNCIKQIQNFQKTAYLLNADPRLTLILTPNSNIFGEPIQQPTLQPQQRSNTPTQYHHQISVSTPSSANTSSTNLISTSTISNTTNNTPSISKETSTTTLNESIIIPTLSSSIDKNVISTTNTDLQQQSSPLTVSSSTSTPTTQPKNNRDLNNIFSIPSLETSGKPLEKKSSQHDLLYRSFTLEDQGKPVRKYSFNTWSSPKKVNFDYFNTTSTTTTQINSNDNNSSNNNANNNGENINDSSPVSPIKMERSQSEKYLPLKSKQLISPLSLNLLNSDISFLDKILESNLNLISSPRKQNESLSSTTPPTTPKQDRQHSESSGAVGNTNNIDDHIICGSSPSPSLGRANDNSNADSSSPIVSSVIINVPLVITTTSQIVNNNSANTSSEINTSEEDIKKSSGSDSFSLISESDAVSTTSSQYYGGQVSEDIIFSIKNQSFIKNRRKSVSTSNIHSINPLSPTSGSLLKPNGMNSPRSANNSPQNGNSGSVSPTGNISSQGNQMTQQHPSPTHNHNNISQQYHHHQSSSSLFKRKSFDPHQTHIRPAHSFIPMSDEGLFSLSLKLEPRGVKLSDLC